MKLTKSEVIEPCCDMAKKWLECFVAENHAIFISTYIYDDTEWFSERIPTTMPMNFCPFCGVKTEIEK